MTRSLRARRVPSIPMPNEVSVISRAYVGLTVVTVSANFMPVFKELITPRSRSAGSS